MDTKSERGVKVINFVFLIKAIMDSQVAITDKMMYKVKPSAVRSENYLHNIKHTVIRFSGWRSEIVPKQGVDLAALHNIISDMSVLRARVARIH